MTYVRPLIQDVPMDIESNCCGGAKCNPPGSQCNPTLHFWFVCADPNNLDAGTPNLGAVPLL